MLSSPGADGLAARDASGLRPRGHPSLPAASAVAPSVAGLLTWADGAALLAVLVWGVNFPVLKLLMTVMDPLPLMFVRAALSSVVLGGVLGLSGQWRFPARRELRPFLTVSLAGFALNQVLYFYGLQLTSASHSGLIFMLTPLLVFGMSHVLGQVRVDRLDLLGLALGVAGAVLILGLPTLGPTPVGGVTLLGDLLTVGAAVTWGVWTILTAPLLRRHGTLLATTWITMLGGLGLLPLAVPGLLSQDWTRLSWPAVAAVIYSATVAGAFGSLLWYAALRRIGAARTAIYANVESFFAVVAAALLLGERVAWTSVLGGAAVAAGVLLTRRPGRAG